MNETNRRVPTRRWTDDFKLDHDLVSLEDTISPEVFAREIEAIFRRTWLYAGRIERVAAPGSFFTKEFEALRASILVTRDKENRLRVFHNVCPHRGNKLVWDTHADRETSGRCMAMQLTAAIRWTMHSLDGRSRMATPMFDHSLAPEYVALPAAVSSSWSSHGRQRPSPATVPWVS